MIRASRNANRTHLLTASAVLIACSCLAQSSFAQESARVLSATPILQKVGIPQQVCTDQQVEVQGEVLQPGQLPNLRGHCDQVVGVQVQPGQALQVADFGVQLGQLVFAHIPEHTGSSSSASVGGV